MVAYVISDIEVIDPYAFEEYKKMSMPAAVKYGAKFLARGGALEVLEGDWAPKRIAILEFADMETARAWVNSAEYAPARAKRKASARSGVILVDGAPPQS